MTVSRTTGRLGSLTVPVLALTFVALAACSDGDSNDVVATAAPATATATAAPATGTPTTAPPTESPPPVAGNQTVDLMAARDNTLIEDPDGEQSNGAGKYLFVGVTSAPEIRRALIAFDVAGAVPPGSTITSVPLTLALSKYAVPDEQQVALHRALADWGEGDSDAVDNEGRGAPAGARDATWLHRFFDTETWENEGGDFAGEASASAAIGGPDLGGGFAPQTWGSTASLVADVQAWLDDPSSNFGWVIVGLEEGERTTKRFNSREHSSAESRPVLTVEYTPAGG